MRNVGWIIVALFIFLSVGFYSRFKNESIKPILSPTPTSIAATGVIPSDLQEEETVPQNQPDAIIVPGESARVQCGEGNTGTRVVFQEGGFAGNVGLGEQATITAKVTDEKGQMAGGLVQWRLYNRGTLQIEACRATFVAPDSIGTAYSTSATINASVVPDTTPTSASTPRGEGGPIFAGYAATTKVGILSGTKPACFDPAGVAISINSVPTTSVVQIRVNTPIVAERVYNGRNATVRDGAGTYEIEIFVDGVLYGTTTSRVQECQLPTVKF